MTVRVCDLCGKRLPDSAPKSYIRKIDGHYLRIGCSRDGDICLECYIKVDARVVPEQKARAELQLREEPSEQL